MPYKSSGGKMVWNETLKRNIPAGWEVKKVVEVIEPIERGISYTSEDIKSNKGIPMLNLACYDKQGEYRSGEMKFFSGKCCDRVYPFEMFIACTDMTQNADIIGRPIFAPTEYKEYVYSMDLARITPKSISKMYLYYTLRTSFYHTYIKPFASGTNVKHLNIYGIERYPIYIPSYGIQKRFEEKIESIKINQQQCLQEIQELTQLRDNLLPLLMNGQVTLNSCLSLYIKYFSLAQLLFPNEKSSTYNLFILYLNYEKINYRNKYLLFLCNYLYHFNYLLSFFLSTYNRENSNSKFLGRFNDRTCNCRFYNRCIYYCYQISFLDSKCE